MSRIVHCTSPLSPCWPLNLLTPTKGTNFWQESSSGLQKEESLVRVWVC